MWGRFRCGWARSALNVARTSIENGRQSHAASARGKNALAGRGPIDLRARPPARPTAQAPGAMAADSTFHLREKLLSHAHELPSAYCL